MPIYKISRRSHAEKRARAVFKRARFVALLLSLLLFAGTIVLLFLNSHK